MSELIFRGTPLKGVVTHSENVYYNNTQSGLRSVNVQGAIDELHNANKISYNNSTSGLNATTVQAAIDEIKRTFLDMTYPVGSVYLSVSNVNPSTLFGGTWAALAANYVLKTITSGTGGTTQAAGNTGSTTLDSTQCALVSHKHSYSAPPDASGGHTLTPSETAITSHTHTYGKASTVTGGHTLTPAETALVSHKHSYSAPPTVTGGHKLTPAETALVVHKHTNSSHKHYIGNHKQDF